MRRDHVPLTETHPEIAELAYGWDPATLTAGSSRTVTWKCDKGHIWSSVPAIVSKGRGCTVCRGIVFLPGFNDVYSVSQELAEQAHGWDPKTTSANSMEKKEWMCAEKHTWIAAITIRVRVGTGCPYCANQRCWPGYNDFASRNIDIANEAYGWDPTLVVAHSHKKRTWRCGLGHYWQTTPDKRSGRGDGCPTCSNRIVLEGFNDIRTTHKALAEEADGWDPTKIMAGSHKKMPWKCLLGHRWEAVVISRTGRQARGCPVCAGKKILIGFNDLKAKFPLIAEEAYNWDPTTVSFGSGKIATWQCSINPEHIWRCSVSNRTKPTSTGCPGCAKYGFKSNEEGILYINSIRNSAGHLAAWKVGITNKNFHRRIMEHRNSFNGAYETQNVYQVSGQGRIIAQLEQITLRWWRKELSFPPYFGREDMADGYSETVSAADIDLPEILVFLANNKAILDENENQLTHP